MSKRLADVQYTNPKYPIKINRVGINSVELPIFVSMKNGGVQHSVAKVDCYVDLAEHLKGTNMSRLIIGLQKFVGQQLSGKLINSIAENIRISAEADTCEVSYRFPYFIQKIAPTSNEPGILPYHICFTGIKTIDTYIFKLGVKVLATSLCPCSKEISEYGAHNQKCLIEMNIQTKENAFIWIEDLINVAEQSASCEIYSVLKRIDEKTVTERAYNNPKFVEDIARSVYMKLSNITDIEKFRVSVESDESIHAHNAIAIITNY
ncbi:MAG TPA: GTP cyclohydrolase FolE2 [Candidatus Dojkabacteria bacterium]|nr:GTP cyclohydrolase FolE2 [Candidatus Dojkabacteria bacterium]